MEVPAAWPLDLTLHEASGRLDVLWSDGMLAHLTGTELRSACRCAGCESGRRAGESPAGEGAAITELRPVGDMGLQIIFNDGHDRGIFPWAYLHELSRR